MLMASPRLTAASARNIGVTSFKLKITRESTDLMGTVMTLKIQRNLSPIESRIITIEIASQKISILEIQKSMMISLTIPRRYTSKSSAHTTNPITKTMLLVV